VTLKEWAYLAPLVGSANDLANGSGETDTKEAQERAGRLGEVFASPQAGIAILLIDTTICDELENPGQVNACVGSSPNPSVVPIGFPHLVAS